MNMHIAGVSKFEPLTHHIMRNVPFVILPCYESSKRRRLEACAMSIGRLARARTTWLWLRQFWCIKFTLVSIFLLVVTGGERLVPTPQL